MAESKTTTATKEPKDPEVKSDEPGATPERGKEGEIQYVDKGEYWQVVDNRLGDSRTSEIPKTLRDVPVPEKRQKEIEERMKAEDERKKAEREQEGLAQEPPPVESTDPNEDEIVVTVSGKTE